MPLTVIVSNASPKPIYVQIEERIRASIMALEAAPGEELPSIRKLAQDLRVSVITTKRAYEDLEREGFIVTRAGRGSFVAEPNRELLREARLREAEGHFALAVAAARAAGADKALVDEMLDFAWKEG
ncbi:MAG: GntR family transcriptional regulator [Spirochaetaceae bacterium]|nr:GntR family transcriptional regulator [Spirochaetaceae bacterium]